MRKAVFYAPVLLAVCVAVVAQDSAYYKAIEKSASTPIQPKEFKQVEQDAFKDYSRPESYERLATAFGTSTESVWAAIYGEVFCNLRQMLTTGTQLVPSYIRPMRNLSPVKAESCQ